MKKTRHAFIPDTQVKAGVATDHLEAAGNYIADKMPDKIIHIGDHWDMPSLSSYDKKGCEGWEDKDVAEDFEAGLEAMDLLLKPIKKKKNYKPQMIFCMGNHENRVERARKDPDNRKFKKFLSDDQFRLKEFGWKVVPFEEVIRVDGIMYSHYFINPDSVFCKPFGAATKVDTMCQKLGGSFSMGHQQIHKVGIAHTASGDRYRGLVSGAFYQHDEEYLGAQKNKQYWRGMIFKNEVWKGDYNIMELSLDYLLDKWL